MLQTQNLVKIYKPKKGVPVKALDGVSLTLPEKGMVFLLGKSGSGKSTLLNVLGGLDRYNDGEILVMGKSTRKWDQSHFDSYRNTYVGFIFQEYNILDEFSVGANIALALQLQGQKPTSERINDILRDVDLDGYGNRNPNELSGGQKQRVAIARALVKNPKIIMADEPTGALDSTTGRQVLSTLKKLSRDKLVIIVSHDREFAEQYADRIVELADGKVIRDAERLEAQEVTIDAVPVYMEDSVSLPEEYVLTDADKDAICEYIQKMIRIGKQPRFSLFSKQSSAFQPTDESRIPVSQEGYKLIKSKLPLKFAFKLGASGLKHKKFRLVMTILLSCVALGFFGLTDTFAAYDYVKTAHASLTDPDNQITYAAFEKNVEREDYYYGFNQMTEDDLKRIEEETGLDVYPVYEANFYINENTPKLDYSSSYFLTDFAGCIEISEELLEDMGAELVAGELPTKSNQIVISTHMAETFMEYGYSENPYAEKPQTIEIGNPKDMIGLTLSSNGYSVTICGIVDTGIDLDRYSTLKDFKEDELTSFAEYIGYMALNSELNYVRRYSLDGMMMVNKDFITTYTNAQLIREIGSRLLLSWSTTECTDYLHDGGMRTFGSINLNQATWLDGKERTELADNEIIISREMYFNYIYPLVEQTPDQSIPAEYDFDRLREEGNGFGKLVNTIFTVKAEPDPYLTERYGISLPEESRELKLVGIIEDEAGERFCVLPAAYTNIDSATNILQTLSPMPKDSRDILTLVEFTAKDFDPDDEVKESYDMMNPVSFELKNLDMIFNILKNVFFWIGLVFVIFASLLFSNFIATSISYKKEEIGILRAIGSRGNDVFRIFFAESFIIAMINFILSFAGTVIVCVVINTLIKSSTGILLTVLNVSIRQALLLFGVCLLSAFVACYLPVKKIASKRPIDAIRDR